MLTAERLREVLRYDPDTGLFQWIKPRGRATADWFAGCLNGSGYFVICVKGKNYRAHRLAWLHVHGTWPTDQIDHRNRQRGDNKIANLRDVSPALNAQNVDGGVEPREPARPNRWRRTKWRARITVDGRVLDLGTFRSEAEAEQARRDAKLKHHPGYIPSASPAC